MRSNIRALSIDVCWIVSVPEYGKELVVAGLVRIKRDLDRLRAVHITRNDRTDARRLLENFLCAPETSTGEVSYLCLASKRLDTKCHTKSEYQVSRQRQKKRPGVPFGESRMRFQHRSSMGCAVRCGNTHLEPKEHPGFALELGSSLFLENARANGTVIGRKRRQSACPIRNRARRSGVAVRS
jgi:hypothetical protein